MKLYIDNQLVAFSGRQDVNMTFKFLDTYNPSAVKTSYSKTISLPDVPENARIFSNMKVRHTFSLFEDNGGRLLEKGYCTLDRIKSVGLVKTYDITLYGGLGDFFYNLKGDDDKPKTLADLYWGDITGMTKVREDLDPIMTWDNQYVFNTWFSSSFDRIWDTFRAVPCIYDDKIMKKNLSIIPAEGGLFPATSSDGSGSAFVGSDASEALLVEAEENTCYAKQDFRSDLMPLGIKYRSIIETICKPENNGGYEVVLDPNFFKETNPYWTNTFLLKGLPTLDYDYTVKSSSLNDFSCNLVRVGNYQGGGSQTSKQTTIVPQESNTPWVAQGQGLRLQDGFTAVETRLEYDIPVFLHVSNSSAILYYRQPMAYCDSPLSAYLTCTNLDTNQVTTLASETWESGRLVNMFKRISKEADPDVYFVGNLKGIATIPQGWTNIRFNLELRNPSAGSDVHIRYKVSGRPNHVVVERKGDFCGPANSQYTGLPANLFNLTTDYLSSTATFEALRFTKKDLLSGTKTPFDYLIWYTKMFNLRFYLEPGNRRVSIFLPEDLIQQYDPVDISDRVCYDREYSKTRKIIDEGFLKFNLTPNKNDTVEAYEEVYGDTLFDGTYAVPLVEGKGQKEYLSSGLKVGSKARHQGNFAERRTPEGYVYYGFNQGDPYNVSYIKDEEVQREEGGETITVTERVHVTDDRSLNFQEGAGRYDFLDLGDGLAETIVMYSGLRSLPWPAYSAIISRTSVDMVRFAGGPCWISGWVPRSTGLHSSLLGADFIHVHDIPHYGIVPSVSNYDWGLTYGNVNFESIIATGNIYDKYLKTFIENVYNDPMVVECYVRLLSPDFRKLYWFDNNYWILVEVSNFNYRDEPVKCKFIRYNYNA